MEEEGEIDGKKEENVVLKNSPIAFRHRRLNAKYFRKYGFYEDAATNLDSLLQDQLEYYKIQEHKESGEEK